MQHEPKRNPEVTIYDVARFAGVSPASVSRVLNQTRVRPEIQVRVEEAIAKLGFRRNMLASALTTKKTGTAGLLVPDVRNPFYAEVVRAIEDTARLHGYSTVICNTDQDSWRQREYVELLRSKGVDGVVAFTNDSVDTYLVELVGEGYPVVLMDRGSQAVSRISLIGPDNVAGGQMAALHLLELGHREIAVIAEDPQWPGSRERVMGCEAMMREWSMTSPITLSYTAESTVAGGLRACREALTQNPGLTAVVCGNDIIAIGALVGLRQSGYAVPERISVVGFDGTAFARSVEPGLTTVAQPVEEMCSAAVEILMKQIRGELTEPQHRVFVPTLWAGRTTGPAPR